RLRLSQARQPPARAQPRSRGIVAARDRGQRRPRPFRHLGRHARRGRLSRAGTVNVPPPRALVWDQPTLARFWGYWSQFPELYFTFKHGTALLSRLGHPLPRDGVVLDYGCGPGYMLERLLDAGFRAAGADFSLAATSTAADRLARRAGFEGVWTVDRLLA